MSPLRAAPQHRSDARVAEGGALLRRYTGKTRIEGSNPSHSASFLQLSSSPLNGSVLRAYAQIDLRLANRLGEHTHWRFKMNKDQVNGKAKELAGKVQEKAGKLVGSKEQEAKGLSKQVSGKVQKKVGDVEKLIENSQ
jgi:uncharacterized protein YjbJ (UPF0337 family)